MAKLADRPDNIGTYVIVEKGDTLSEICEDYCGGYNEAKVKRLALMNNISDPDHITIGQKIYISKNSTSGGSSSTSSSTYQEIKIEALGEQANTEGTLFAAWSWNGSNLDHYAFKWYYATGDGYAFLGEEGETNYKNDTFQIPDQAYKIVFQVKPVAKLKSDGKTRYWTADWVKQEYYCHENTVRDVDTPTVEILEGTQLVATLSNVDLEALNATGIEFEIVVVNRQLLATPIGGGRGTLRADGSTVTFKQTVSENGEYQVRCRAYRTWGGKDYYGKWSAPSSSYFSSPTAPVLDTVSIVEGTENHEIPEVSIQWTANSSPTVTGYEIQHAIYERYFDASDSIDTKTISDKNIKQWIWKGLELGHTHYFRVRTLSEGDAKSEWSNIKYIKIGGKPNVPTTWSSSTVIEQETDKILKLYWVHNSEDGTGQKAANVKLYKNGDLYITVLVAMNSSPYSWDTDGIEYVPPTGLKDGEVGTCYLKIDTERLVGFKTLEWEVQTLGVGSTQWSDWSTKRTIQIYGKVSLSTGVYVNDTATNNIRSFPFQIRAYPSAVGQTPIGYHVHITANNAYETIDNIGNNKYVNAGESVYSKYFDTTDKVLSIEMSAHNIDLMDGVSYTVTSTVTMDSGITKEATSTFHVSWDDVHYRPNAEITIDKDRLVAYINPYCEDYEYTCYKVEKKKYGRVYVYEPTTTKVEIIGGVEVEGVYTTTGEQVCEGVMSDGEMITYYWESATPSLRPKITLSVYRREYDGSFVEIGKDLDNTKGVCVTDPHPALDYARYRIIAKDDDTGSISYYDVPGVPVNEHAVVIQWSEAWTNFDNTYKNDYDEIKSIDDDPMYAWNGTMLKLPYNIDVAPKVDKEVSLVNYIGRKHPVSYYGTNLNETATWNVDIPKADTATLYALRRLSVWMDNVYVREPSGTGYWADVSVTFPQKHCDVVIPVTFEISRVEGGV